MKENCFSASKGEPELLYRASVIFASWLFIDICFPFVESTKKKLSMRLFYCNCLICVSRLQELEELFDHFFKEEDENITKQQKEKAKRERERLEEQKREEQKESHRMLAKLKAETRKREKKMLRGHKRMLAELVYERAMEEETGKMSKKFNKKLERMQKEVEDALREIQRSECTIL